MILMSIPAHLFLHPSHMSVNYYESSYELFPSFFFGLFQALSRETGRHSTCTNNFEPELFLPDFLFSVDFFIQHESALQCQRRIRFESERVRLHQGPGGPDLPEPLLLPSERRFGRPHSNRQVERHGESHAIRGQRS